MATTRRPRSLTSPDLPHAQVSASPEPTETESPPVDTQDDQNDQGDGGSSGSD